MKPLTHRRPVEEDPSRHPWWPVIHYEYLGGAPDIYITETCGLGVTQLRQLPCTIIDDGRLEPRPRHHCFTHFYGAMAAAEFGA